MIRAKFSSSHAAAFAAVSMLVVGAAPPALAAEAPATIDPSESCATGDCHTDVTKRSHPHWDDFDEPGECQTCHESEAEELHVFEVEDVPNLCVNCHEEIGDRITSEATVHDPAEDCTDCHDPHGAKVASLLLNVREEDDLKPLCWECHDEDLLEGEYTHGPAERGECTLCHDPHASPNPTLLLEVGIDLCGDCHEEIAELVKESEYVHDPVEEGCVECHDPHSGPHPKMLQGAKKELCNECHDDVVDEATVATVDHEPVLTGDECLNCHSPHASNSPANLLEPQRDLCLGCHNKPVKSGDDMLIDMAEWLAQNRVWHQPIKDDDCASCHQPHGSENFRLLAEPFPAKFYAGFDIELYGLCFTCHDDELVTIQWTRTLTGFRDGDRNLHFLHVNKQDRGRTCRACHELHASPKPLHIREEVPFGRWMMPIAFEKQENGGSCHPGCHKLQSYDRDADDYLDGE